MTLQNLKYAMYINNLVLLDKIKRVKDLVDIADVDISEHLNNLTIHVTQEDKDTWNAMLENAKKYAKELFDAVTSFQVIKVEELPTEDIKSMCIYLLAVDPNDKDYYEEYMYIDGNWEIIGSTRINLEPYILKAEVEELLKSYPLTSELEKMLEDYSLKKDVEALLKDYALSKDIEKRLDDYLLKTDSHKHDNLNVLDELSDIDGMLNYKGNPTYPVVTDEQIQQAITDTLKILNKEE